MGTPPAGGRGRRLAVPSPGALADRLGVSPVTVVVGVVAVVGAAIGGWWALRTPPGPDPAEILPMAGSVEIPVPDPSPMPDPGRMVVDVVGAVVRPGLHELPATSRVADAVEAAGGLTAEADRMRLNLAEPLSDGSRLWVPAVGEPAGPEVVSVTAGTVAAFAAGQVGIQQAALIRGKRPVDRLIHHSLCRFAVHDRSVPGMPGPEPNSAYRAQWIGRSASATRRGRGTAGP